MRVKYIKYVVLITLGIMLLGLGTFSMLAPNFSFSFHKPGTSRLAAPATFGAISGYANKDTNQIQSEIEALVTRYFDAKQAVDMTTIGDCVSDVSYVEENKLIAEANYVEKYNIIQCLTLDGATPGSYRVYVYYGVKVYNIETAIPSLSAIYVNTNDQGELQVYLGAVSGDEQAYINHLDDTAEVSTLVDKVQSNLKKTMEADAKVREFYEMLESAEQSN